MAISNSASPEIIWGLGGPEEDHQLHHCCWTGHVVEREEEEEGYTKGKYIRVKCVGSKDKHRSRGIVAYRNSFAMFFIGE